MNRKTAGIVVTMGIVLAASFGTGGAQNSPGSAAIDASLRGAVERKDVPGVVALVTDRQRVLYQGAFGVADVATGRELTADALFRIASMTKVVTSLAAMQLVEQGRFGLEDPVELEDRLVVERGHDLLAHVDHRVIRGGRDIR